MPRETAIPLLGMYSKDMYQKVHGSTIQNNLQTRHYPMGEVSQQRLISDRCNRNLEEGYGQLAKLSQEGSSEITLQEGEAALRFRHGGGKMDRGKRCEPA